MNITNIARRVVDRAIAAKISQKSCNYKTRCTDLIALQLEVKRRAPRSRLVIKGQVVKLYL